MEQSWEPCLLFKNNDMYLAARMTDIIFVFVFSQVRSSNLYCKSKLLFHSHSNV